MSDIELECPCECDARSQEFRSSYALGALGFVVLVVLALFSLQAVPNLHYGIRYNTAGKWADVDHVYTAGRYLIGPWNTFVLFPAVVQNVEFSNTFGLAASGHRYPALHTRTKEGLALNLEVSLQYRLKEAQVGKLYTEFNVDFQNFFVSTIRESVIKVAADYEAYQLWDQRKEVGNQMQREVNAVLNRTYAECWGLQLLDIALPKAFDQSIVQTQVQNQAISTEKFAQESTQIRAMTSVIESQYEKEIKVITVAGEANYTLITKTAKGELQWSPGEMRQEVTLELLPKQLSEAADQFQLVLEDPEGGAIFNPNQDGSEDRCVLTITILNENDELTRNIAAMKMSQFVDKVMNIDKLRLGAQSWYEDIISSVCDVTDDGERASCLDWMHHIFSMPWKFTLSVLIPPTAYCGGWLCFVMAIGAIGVLTCAICDFAELFGCVTSLEDSITAITIVALGTSMPDLFASQTAAVTDRYADASIVNVTGSNSVNVFLDIGLPWSIAAIYWSVAGPTQKWLDSYESHLGTWPKAAFIVQGGDLAFSVAVFNVAAGLALLIIHLRRSRLQGELGGPGGMKVLSGLLLISLWLFYLTLSIWKIKSNTTDIGTQIFAIFIGFCSLENLVLLFSCALLMRFGTAFFTGRPGQQADDEEAARLVADGREVASKGDLRHVARPGLSPVAPPAFTVKEVHGRPECYGRQNKSLDISFTSAAFVCFAAKRLQRAGRKVAESFRGLPPMPPPMFPPPSTTLSALSPVGPQGGIERVPSFYSIDSQEGRDRQRRPSLTGRMAGLISGHAADWAALTVAGLAAGTLADPNGPRFLG